MTERQKVADLPQEEREQLIQRASDAGIKNAMIATWYVDTLEAKIAAAATKKDEDQGSDDEQKTNETPADAADIDPAAEANELDKDTEPPAPAAQKQQKKAAKNTKPQRVTICHICRSKVIDGKCTGCDFDISKR